jgi:hypothetical protein
MILDNESGSERQATRCRMKSNTTYNDKQSSIHFKSIILSFSFFQSRRCWAGRGCRACRASGALNGRYSSLKSSSKCSIHHIIKNEKKIGLRTCKIFLCHRPVLFPRTSPQGLRGAKRSFFLIQVLVERFFSCAGSLFGRAWLQGAILTPKSNRKSGAISHESLSEKKKKNQPMSFSAFYVHSRKVARNMGDRMKIEPMLPHK